MSLGTPNEPPNEQPQPKGQAKAQPKEPDREPPAAPPKPSERTEPQATPGARDRTMDLGPEPDALATLPGAMATADIRQTEVVMAADIRSAADLPVVDRSNYHIIEEFARGGLGRIMRARDKRTGRIVAIKEIIGKSDLIARRFAREALITANLQHPSIVPVYELGRWESGEPFYAMKLVTGTSFRQVIKGAKTLDERLARLPVILRVAEALAFAHGKRIIHRDLKPANVLIGDFGETVVIDWGLAKPIGELDISDQDVAGMADAIVGDHTIDGAVVGTPVYMSPEQARGEHLDERDDVYAIGAMLYHLIYGHSPYHERRLKSSRDLVALVAAEPPAPLDELEPGTPPELLTIVNKAMSRDRPLRYASANELSEDLRRFSAGNLVSAHHYDRRTLLMRWLKRHRAPVIVGVILAALLVIVAMISVRRVVAERDYALTQSTRAEESLAFALFDKGRVAEDAQKWARAAMYYAASRQHHDTQKAAWAAGLAEAQAVIPIVRYDGHDAWVHAVAISRDGERVATVDDLGQLRVWSPRDGRTFVARKLSAHALYAVAFSPDGELAVAGDDGDIQRFSADLALVGTLKRHVGRVWSLAYSPDGKLLASGGEDARVMLWPLEHPDHPDAPRELLGHTQRVYWVTFSDDGKTLASASDDRSFWLWDVATGKGARRGEHLAGGIKVVMFDGNTVVSTGWDHAIKVWKDQQDHPDEWNDQYIVHAAALVPGGEVLVTGGEMDSVHAWDMTTHQMIASLDTPGGQISAMAFSRDGRWLVTAGKAPPISWDATALGRRAGTGHRLDLGMLSFNSDGTKLASGSIDHTVRVWDVASGAELRRISTRAWCGEGVTMIGKDEVAAECDDRVLRLWKPTGPPLELPTDIWLRFADISPDGKTLAAGHEGGIVELFDVASWKLISSSKLHHHQVYGVHYARDGRLVTASLDDHVRTWRGRELTPDLDVHVEADNGELDGELSPDGSQLAAATSLGINVWDVHGTKWLARIRMTEPSIVWRIVFSPDSKHAYSAGDDGLVRIWDTQTWRDPVLLDAGEGAVHALALSPDGKTLASGYLSGALVLWDVATRKAARRIGGRVRELGSCSDIDSQAWLDAEHRAIVAAACLSSPQEYLRRLGARTHQRLDGDVDVTWDWLRPER